MELFQDSLQNLNLQQTLRIHDETVNVPSSPPPTASASSDSLFQLQQSLYAAFQHTASCITQLYKQKLETVSHEQGGERWQAFQRTAAAATVLYREACDAVRKAQDIVKLNESIASTKPQGALSNTLQQAKRTRRNAASSKRHTSTSQLSVSGSVNAVEYDAVSFGGAPTASNNNVNVPLSDASDDDSAPVVFRAGTGAVLEVGIGANSPSLGAFGRTEPSAAASASASGGAARKRLHADELFATDTSGGCSSSPAPRIDNAPPLPADFERASVEYFREQKRARV